jgi:hypothetical protein
VKVAFEYASSGSLKLEWGTTRKLSPMMATGVSSSFVAVEGSTRERTRLSIRSVQAGTSERSDT